MHDANVLGIRNTVYYRRLVSSRRAGPYQPIIRLQFHAFTKTYLLRQRRRNAPETFAAGTENIQYGAGWTISPTVRCLNTVFTGGVNGVGDHCRSYCAGNKQKSPQNGQGGVVMAVKQTAGKRTLGNLLPNLQISQMMCLYIPGRCG